MGMKPERDQAKPPPSPESLLPRLLLLVADDVRKFDADSPI